MKARVNLKAAWLTCTDPQLLRKLNNQLQSIMNDFRSNLPENEGTVVLPAVHERAESVNEQEISELSVTSSI